MSKLPSLKRKAADDAGPVQPKIAAFGSSTSARPTRSLRSTAAGPAAVAKALGKGSAPALAASRAPLRQKSNNNLSTSNQGPAKPRVVSAAPTKPVTRGAQRVLAGRRLKPPAAVAPAGDKLTQIQEQLNSMRTAQQNDRDTLQAEMAAERAKREELERFHVKKEVELELRRTNDEQIRRHAQELDQVRAQYSTRLVDAEDSRNRLDRENRQLRDDKQVLEDDVHSRDNSIRTLKETVSQMTTAHMSIEAQLTAIKSHSGATATHLQAAREQIDSLKQQLLAKDDVIAEQRLEILDSEAIRRKLHNQVQELKGNIRVYCRVRPPLREKREVVLSSWSENAMGAERKETWQFAFDRVFGPQSTQAEVFDEVGQLAQSCVDGYNICIFAYGQTGSGKSYTMEGGRTTDTIGMIPRAIEHVFVAAEQLRAKGWEYTLEGQFVEIYNETINDLLGSGEFDKKKHEVKHDAKACSTRITDVVVVPLRSASEVTTLLSRAQSRRSVAATLMNERSSRSHSVFTLRIAGVNNATGERCEGALNLVDLAGSERLNASGAAGDKDRLKETQSINRSLSALGDVIAALGQGGEKAHIPYRNSKLTYLLQYSLSGNSKTLMMLNLSPLAAHLNESLCSLRFATKVNNTTLGTAKRQIKST
ncbi:kinesin-domain-containing protein [Auriculariales sp. MPI-PUGE-AT-0066]|nr:kinesin-domain-containing protein [Auriculariales sp. MPI-PUGE-AT-0066]